MKIDTELLKVIDDAMAHSKDDTEALDKVLDFLKVHREMKGWHVSVDPDFAAKPDMDMATKTKTLAHEVLMMLREESLGRLEEVDLEELDRRPEDNEFCPKVLEEIRVPRKKKEDPRDPKLWEANREGLRLMGELIPYFDPACWQGYKTGERKDDGRSE